MPKNNGQGFDFEFVSIICKKKLKIKELNIEYTPRKNSKEKKIKFYHMFNAIYEIFKVKFFKNKLLNFSLIILTMYSA